MTNLIKFGATLDIRDSARAVYHTEMIFLKYSILSCEYLNMGFSINKREIDGKDVGDEISLYIN